MSHKQNANNETASKFEFLTTEDNFYTVMKKQNYKLISGRQIPRSKQNKKK